MIWAGEARSRDKASDIDRVWYGNIDPASRWEWKEATIGQEKLGDWDLTRCGVR